MKVGRCAVAGVTDLGNLLTCFNISAQVDPYRGWALCNPAYSQRTILRKEENGQRSVLYFLLTFTLNHIHVTVSVTDPRASWAVGLNELPGVRHHPALALYLQIDDIFHQMKMMIKRVNLTMILFSVLRNY